MVRTVGWMERATEQLASQVRPLGERYAQSLPGILIAKMGTAGAQSLACACAMVDVACCRYGIIDARLAAGDVDVNGGTLPGHIYVIGDDLVIDFNLAQLVRNRGVDWPAVIVGPELELAELGIAYREISALTARASRLVARYLRRVRLDACNAMSQGGH